MATQAQNAPSPHFGKIRVRAFRYAKTCGLKASDAEDIAQDVLLWFLENPEKADKRLVKWVTVDAIRLRFQDKPHLDIHKMPESVWVDHNTPPPKINEVRNCYKLIRPGIDRAAFVLTHKWGLTHDEIAEVFGLSYTTIARAMTYAGMDLAVDLNGEKKRRATAEK